MLIAWLSSGSNGFNPPRAPPPPGTHNDVEADVHTEHHPRGDSHTLAGKLLETLVEDGAGGPSAVIQGEVVMDTCGGGMGRVSTLGTNY